jgi:hypothetical protein
MSGDLIAFIVYVVGAVVVYLGLRIVFHLTDEKWDGEAVPVFLLWPVFVVFGVIGGFCYLLMRADKLIAFALRKIFPRRS